MTELEADQARMGMPTCGIPVRAKVGDRWEAVDIVHLKRESLLEWLRSREGLAESTLLAIFGHQR